MVLPFLLAGLGAAGSLVSGLSARSAAKSTQKRAAANDMVAKAHNTAEIKFRNKEKKRLGKALLKEKEVTTEQTTGTNTRTSKTSSSFDADAMMKAAEASGINPITFLRNGGMAAFVNTQTDEADTYGTTVKTTRKGHNAVAAYEMMLRDPDLHNAAPTTHVPGAGEAVGSAMSSFANAAGDIVARQDAQAFTAAQAEKHQAFQKELMMMSLQGTQKGGSIPGGRSFYTPGFATSGGTVKRQTQGGLSGVTGAPTKPTAGDTTVTNPWMTWNVDPTVRDASARQDRYGESELAETVSFVDMSMADVMYNITGMTQKERYDTYGKPFMKNVKQFFGGLGLSFDPKGNKENSPLFLRVKPKAAQ